MKHILNITIFALLSLSCDCQTRINELTQERDSIDNLLQKEIQELLTANTKLHFQKDSILFIIDSLKLVIENLESQPVSDSLYADTTSFYVFDSLGSEFWFYKYGKQMNSTIVKDSLRIMSLMGDSRSVYYMNGLETELSILEDSLYYYVNFIDSELQLKKRK